VYATMMRFSQDVGSDLRRIAVVGFHDLCILTDDMKPIMIELIELLDDEESSVKIEAFNCLADVFKNCNKQDVDAVGIIKIVQSIFIQAIIKLPGPDFLSIII